jgi:hypothetical protein
MGGNASELETRAEKTLTSRGPERYSEKSGGKSLLARNWGRVKEFAEDKGDDDLASTFVADCCVVVLCVIDCRALLRKSP